MPRECCDCKGKEVAYYKVYEAIDEDPAEICFLCTACYETTDETLEPCEVWRQKQELLEWKSIECLASDEEAQAIQKKEEEAISPMMRRIMEAEERSLPKTLQEAIARLEKF